MIRKLFLLTGIVFLYSISKAQRSIEGLIKAEISFAGYSVAMGANVCCTIKKIAKIFPISRFIPKFRGMDYGKSLHFNLHHSPQKP